MKPKVAILASRLPWPLVKGDSLRLYEQIKVLAQSCEIHLYCLSEEYAEGEAYEALTPFCTKIHLFRLSTFQRKVNIAFNYLGKLPMQVRYFFDHHIKKQIQSSLYELNPDHIYVQLIRMAPYVQGLRRKTPMTLDFMDSMILNDLAGGYLDKGFKRMLLHRERRLVRDYEASITASFDHHFVISERDRDMLPINIREQVQILSNGVDSAKFSLNTDLESRSYDILFCGNMAYPPNIAAAKYLMKDIRPLGPDISCLIAGIEAEQLMQYKGADNCTIVGYQDNIQSIYDRGRIMVVPIFTGSGQQNKVIEAMACGVPCIVTSFVNQAIRAEPGKEVILADDAAAFVTSINDLLSHPEKMKDLSKAGRVFVERGYNWESNTKPLVDTILKSSIRQHGR